MVCNATFMIGFEKLIGRKVFSPSNLVTCNNSARGEIVGLYFAENEPHVAFYSDDGEFVMRPLRRVVLQEGQEELI